MLLCGTGNERHNFYLFKEMKDLYTQISDWMDTHGDGWSTKPKVAALVGAILALRPNVVLEIGLWSGKSFIPQAMALKHLNSKGCIIGIDPWSASASIEGQEGDHKDWWAKAPHERIYKQFTDEIVKAGVSPWCKVFRCRSDEWNIPEGIEFDLLHVDGNHGEAASNYDLLHYVPRVRIGGVLFWDDLLWSEKASSKIETLGFRKLFLEDTGAMYQRIKK